MTRHAAPPPDPVAARLAGRLWEPRARRILAVVVARHGLAHLAGTADVLGRARDGRAADHLAGAWTVGDPTALRALGVAWAALALALVIVSAGIAAGRRWWPRRLGHVAAASLVLVLVALWASVIGVVVDVLLVGTALAARRAVR